MGIEKNGRSGCVYSTEAVVGGSAACVILSSLSLFIYLLSLSTDRSVCLSVCLSGKNQSAHECRDGGKKDVSSVFVCVCGGRQ